MFQESILKNLSASFDAERTKFTKKDVAFIAGKDSFKGKMLGFLTFDYYRREKLIREGNLVYGYAYRAWTNEVTYTKPYPIWVLFSPAKEFVENPSLYGDVLRALQAIEKPKHRHAKIYHLYTMLNAELSEPKYVLIPEPYAQGHLVYLSMVYLRPSHHANLCLGVNPFLIAPNVSKEILLLPSKYWTEEFKKEYFNL
ncbi:MAG: hypothetical protein WC282_02075 [Bacilli bacterium]|jgi:hypothetical protein